HIFASQFIDWRPKSESGGARTRDGPHPGMHMQVSSTGPDLRWLTPQRYRSRVAMSKLRQEVRNADSAGPLPRCRPAWHRQWILKPKTKLGPIPEREARLRNPAPD